MSHVNIIVACSALALFASISSTEAGMSCDVIGGSCPGLFNSADKSFCCFKNGGQKCCTEEEFVVTIGAGAVLPIVLGVLTLVVIFICCICCACCSCCPCYRKRERGAVYAVRGPSTVVQVNQNPPATYEQNLYPAQSAGMPQPPPTYSNEVYSKQSPYNPNYPNP